MMNLNRLWGATCLSLAVLAPVACETASAASSAPYNTCSSMSSCQSLAKRVFHKYILMPSRATIVGQGGYGHDGLGIFFRLPVGQDFDTIVSRARPKCSLNATASTGRHFCFLAVQNGYLASFTADGLEYIISGVQDQPKEAVPGLRQAITAVASYGKP